MASRKTVANLNIKIGASHASLKKDFDKAGGHTKRFSKNAGKNVGRLSGMFSGITSGLSGVAAAAGPVGLAIAAAATVAFIAWKAFKTVVSNVRAEMERLDESLDVAQKLGTSLGQLEAARLAANRAGVDDKQLDTALQRMVRRISQAAQGSGEAKKVLDELGLSAEHLNDLTATDALKEITTALSGVENQADRVRLAFGLFDSEGVGLVNLKTDGIKQAEEDVKGFGLVITELERTQFKDMSAAWVSVGRVFQGVFRQLAVAVAPALKEIADSIVRFGIKLVEKVKQLKPAITGFFLGVAKVVEFAFFLGEKVLWVIEKIAKGAEVVGLIELGEIDTTDAESNVAGITESLEAMLAAINAEPVEVNVETSKLEEQLNEMMRQGEALREQLRTPVEIFAEKQADLKKLFDVGAIDPETFKRASNAAAMSFRDAMTSEFDALQPKFAAATSTGAAVRGTTAGFSAVRQGQNKLKDMLESDKRREKLMKFIAERERESERLLKKIETHTKKGTDTRVVRI